MDNMRYHNLDINIIQVNIHIIAVYTNPLKYNYRSYIIFIL